MLLISGLDSLTRRCHGEAPSYKRDSYMSDCNGTELPIVIKRTAQVGLATDVASHSAAQVGRATYVASHSSAQVGLATHVASYSAAQVGLATDVASHSAAQVGLASDIAPLFTSLSYGSC